ncbi:PREDICTED: LOW QUALITY PROTEIN: UBX domain-containing protein 6-like [Acropora digitifera]|uniref:LOW QUALITY PROTEIN: UBX domain-containing protein 6-like n=1 Tax=Acropora digitifera TaxID=70779 RepID=UPI000779F312|nr:PREDICTED: LOW QUALITY PROTEIN: UBX domain-containing protein 6-like [Acropora digitifera]
MKKLFQKAKLDYRFKRAGEGHALQDESSTSQQSSTPQTPAARALPTSDAQRAGQAALDRFANLEKNAVKRPKSATATWKHSGSTTTFSESSDAGNSLNLEQLRKEVKQEMSTEIDFVMRGDAANLPQPAVAEPTHVDCSTVQAHEGVYFSCPLCPASTLLSEKDEHLSACFDKCYLEEALQLHAQCYSLNKDTNKIKACIDLLCRYLDNICKNPDEEKFQKIKKSNKVFQERVAPIRGAVQFLLACGFEDKVISVEGLEEENYFVMPKEKCSDCEPLEAFKEVLLSSEALKPKLDRCLKVFKPTNQASHFEVPSDFFSKTSEEIKRAQISRSEEVERSCQLKTRAMREAEKRPTKIYRFTLIRVRFPDGFILQGTFYSREKVRDVVEFVRQSLVSDWQPFQLFETTGQLKDENASLIDLGLVSGKCNSNAK